MTNGAWAGREAARAAACTAAVAFSSLRASLREAFTVVPKKNANTSMITVSTTLEVATI